MTISDDDLLPATFRQMLANLTNWLGVAADHMTRIGQDPDSMLSWRLAPDMYPLAGQIRFACFLAREPHYHLSGRPLPAAVLEIRERGWSSHEQPGTFAEANALLAKTITSLDRKNTPKQDEGVVQLLAFELPDGSIFDLTSEQYVRDWALPQFYFHVNAAYAILRMNGVNLGKRDYAHHMFKYVRSAEVTVHTARKASISRSMSAPLL